MIFALSATSVSIDVQIVDDLGVVVTGLVAATFPALSYSRAGANADVSISLIDLATITTAWSSGGVKERGNGYYRLDLPNAAFANAGNVTIRGEASGKHLLAPVLEIGSVPTTAQIVSALSAVNITITSPAVAADGDFTVVQGDDYLAVDNRAFLFDLASPDLTGFTVTLAIANDTTSLSVIGSILNAGLPNQQLRFELTDTNTRSLAFGSWDYQIHGESGVGTFYPTILGGKCRVTRRIGS